MSFGITLQYENNQTIGNKELINIIEVTKKKKEEK